MDKKTKEVKYIIISPVRNEEKFIERTIHSVISQTVQPITWVIVNDGSRDKTEDIVRTYLSEYTWIKLTNLPDRGCRKGGSGVIEAFYVGYNIIKNLNYDFIVKLDGDLSFERDYFEKLFEKFYSNSKLGIAGGYVYDFVKNNLRPHVFPAHHVRGCVKTYRKECFEEIGGLLSTLGWDGIDEMKAQMRGWKTRSFRELRVIHYRPMGSVGGILRGRLRGAISACKMGYHPLFMIGRCLRRMIIDKPYIIGGLVMILGFFYYKIKGIKPIDDPQLISFIREYQKKRMRFWRRS